MSSAPRDFTITSQRRVALTPAEVHHLITHPATWREWQSEIETAHGPDELAPGDTVQGDARMLGFIVQGRADMESVAAERITHEAIVGVKMRVTYDLEAAGSGVVVRHTLTAEMPRGLAGRVLSFFLRRRLRAMQRKLLDNLAQRVP